MKKVLSSGLLAATAVVMSIALTTGCTSAKATDGTTVPTPGPGPGPILPPPPPPPAVTQYSLDSYLARPCETEMSPDTMIHYTATLVSALQLHDKLVHDCQRLLLDRDNYGPLVAIQVGNNLDSLVKTVDSGVVLADVVNYDRRQGYAPLDIRPRLNCLWARGNPAHPESWHIEMLHPDSTCVNAKPLRRPLPPFPPAARLTVHPIDYALRGAHASTARWGWDGTRQFIGIHCGKAWCEIGPSGFTPSAVQRGDELGFGDEQYLATKGTEPNSRVYPSHVWGRIVPRRILLETDSFKFSKAQLVATILLREDRDPPQKAADNRRVHEQYNRRFSLTADETPLWMKFVGQGRYLIATGPDTANWTLMKRCDWKHAADGAVRWRWDPADENAWLACTHGCCTTDHIGAAVNQP